MKKHLDELRSRLIEAEEAENREAADSIRQQYLRASAVAYWSGWLVSRADYHTAIKDSVEISNRLAEYYDYDQAARWWTSPHPQLNGATPADHILGNPDGRADIHAILNRLDADAYI